MYVHDVIGGRDNVEFAKTSKVNIVKIFNKACFKLHKVTPMLQKRRNRKTSQK